MRILLVILVFVGVVYGQTPKPCLAPAVWEGKVIQYDISKQFEMRGRMAYDAYNERIHVVDEVNLVDKKDYFSSLFLHRERKEYQLNMKTKECKVTELTRPFRPVRIPNNATFYGETIIGSLAAPGEGVTVQLWGGHTEHGRYAGSWTVKGCIPVSEVYFSNQTGVVHTDFFDVTAGIHDPDVFIPPKECM
ncbi:mammalian ependymin-related protein 1-like [Ptychodera flava]|uniref:mammalian ependymin-related protein 1-like n=1 Tax=Ptychodera flava TaxID=63121 RepID=UPI003969C411